MKKNILCKWFLGISILIFVFSLSPNSVLADEKDEKKKDTYCIICNKDEDDPLYEKERQFNEKIKIIKSIFGNRIDEVVLAETVLHRYGQDYVYNREYTEDFKSDDYTSMWREMYSSIGSNLSKLLISEDDKKRIDENEKIDLLTLAAIVMIDSNSGQYSDVCYRDGLAGKGLVGNTKDNDAFANLQNGLFCGVYGVATKIESPLNFASRLFNKDSFLVAGLSSKNRVANIKRVCDNGYVGGLYSNVYNIKDEEQKEIMKKHTADEIINFANYYKKLYGDYNEGDAKCSSNVAGATGDFASWRQFDDRWKDISLGDASSVGRAGCLVTSISMQIARSGTKIGTLPSGYSEFNPGAFVTSLNKNNGFAGGGNYAWSGQNEIAPNWVYGDFVSLNVSSNKKLADAVSKELSEGIDNKQKFLVLQIRHANSSQHWIAVNGVEDGKVTIYDPAKNGTTLDENYNNWVVEGYKIMYANDVSFGQTGTTANNTCTSSSGSSGTGQGNIVIPEQYGAGGYTVTTIDTINWDPSSEQAKIVNEWKSKGSKYNDGIAVIDGRYLIACTSTFGKVGDQVDFFLDDGTLIPTIIMDEKSQAYVPWDHNPANKWGHDNGANVLEFEVAYSYYSRYGNPGSNGWYTQWSGKRVASATNITNGGVSSTSDNGNGTDGKKCVNGVGIGGGGISGSAGQKIARLAVRVAGTATPDKELTITGSDRKEQINDSRLSDYYKIMKATIHRYPPNDPKNPETHNNYAIASCAQAAAGVIRATVDPDLETNGPDAMINYLNKHTEKWTLIDTLKSSDNLDEKCQPGDLLICSGHVAIYVGNEYAREKFPNTTGNLFEAHYGIGGYPWISEAKKAGWPFMIYRSTGGGNFTYELINIEEVLGS